MISNKLKKLITSEFNKINKFENKNINVAYPYFDNREILGVLDSLFKLQISQGVKTKKFEADYSKYIGMPYAAAVNSGSSANLIAFAAMIDIGMINVGDEVIVPSTTFATVVSPLYQLGLVPVYVDIEYENFNIDVEKIEKAISKKTKVIMPVHTLGFPADIINMKRIAKKYKLIIFEDCCEAHGAKVGNKLIGSFGDISTWSFFVAHNLTTGEGGMILTKNKKLLESIKSIREFGRLVNYKTRFFNSKKMKDFDSRYMFMKVGYNVRLTDIAASIGIEQLKKLNSINKIRRNNAKYLNNLLSEFKQLHIPQPMTDHTCAYYGFPILLRDKKFSRKKLCSFLESKKIETRSIMGGTLPDQPAFNNKKHRISGNLNTSRLIKNNAFFIGIHAALGKKDFDRIFDAFRQFFSN